MGCGLDMAYCISNRAIIKLHRNIPHTVEGFPDNRPPAALSGFRAVALQVSSAKKALAAAAGRAGSEGEGRPLFTGAASWACGECRDSSG